jgi:integrase
MTEPSPSPRVECRVDPSTEFLAVAAEWLAHAEPQLRGAIKTYKLYVKTHFAPFFMTLGGFTDDACSRYVSHRLRTVRRSTLQKELSALRWLGEWCADQGFLSRAPNIPKPRRGAVGTSYHVRRRGQAEEFSREEIEAVIAALPEFSSSKRVTSFPVRARFIVAMETGLRPSTLDKLEAPRDYTAGSTVLRIRNDADKNHFGRDLPLTARARAALDGVCPSEGLIFGRHDFRDAIRAAATSALPADRAAAFTPYCLRHARLTELAETGNLVGAAYLSGHRQVTTINRYARPNRRAAEEVLKALDLRAAQRAPASNEPPSAPPPPDKPDWSALLPHYPRPLLAVVPTPPNSPANSRCEGEASQRGDGDAPARTSVSPEQRLYGRGDLQRRDGHEHGATMRPHDGPRLTLAQVPPPISEHKARTLPNNMNECEGGDLNPHESYLASTSS